MTHSMHQLTWTTNPGDTVRWLTQFNGTWRQANPCALADGLYIDIQGQPTLLVKFEQTLCASGGHVRIHDILCKG